VVVDWTSSDRQSSIVGGCFPRKMGYGSSTLRIRTSLAELDDGRNLDAYLRVTNEETGVQPVFFQKHNGGGDKSSAPRDSFSRQGAKTSLRPSFKSSMMLLLFLFVPFAKALVLIRSPSGMMRSEVIDRR